MEDGFRGFPAFLSNNFVHTARNQLIQGIQQRQLLPPEQLSNMVQTSDEYLKKNKAV
jgi:hypothetical protein